MNANVEKWIDRHADPAGSDLPDQWTCPCCGAVMDLDRERRWYECGGLAGCLSSVNAAYVRAEMADGAR